MRKTRLTRAREMLLERGIKSAEDFPDAALGAKPERNRGIVQAVIFDGCTLKAAGAAAGISHEQARVISLISVIRLIGEYENWNENPSRS